jgi:hypothetical protein
MIDFLNSLHTKQLLSLYRFCIPRRWDDKIVKKDLWPGYAARSIRSYRSIRFVYNNMSETDSFTAQQVKDILDTREHIKTKKEK